MRSLTPTTSNKLVIDGLTEKILDLLTDNNHMSAKAIAKKCHCKIWKVYDVIRKLRIRGTGVHPTKLGYILSEFASKQDDVGFLRRINGRRTSDLISVLAARPHILQRWKSVQESRDLNHMLAPILAQKKTLEDNRKLILNYEKKLESTLEKK